jgi:RNA polymerase sigma-70 factor (ECF subfamily)
MKRRPDFNSSYPVPCRVTVVTRPQASAHNHAVVDAVYESAAHFIYIRCRRMLRDRTLAQDATQEIFLKLLRSSGALPSGPKFWAFVAQTTRNHCLNILRDTHGAPESVAPECLPDVAGADLESRIVSKNFAEQMLAAQPQHLRSLAMLHYVEGVAQTAIATALDVSRRTVLYRLAEFTQRAHRFRNNLHSSS